MKVSHNQFIAAADGSEFNVDNAAFSKFVLPDGWHVLVATKPVAASDAPARQWPEGNAWTSLLRPFTGPLLDVPLHRPLKVSPRNSVIVTRLREGIPIVCKDSRERSLTSAIGSTLRGPRCWHEFWHGHALRAFGVTTPIPIAILLRKHGTFGYECRLITWYLQDAAPLDVRLRELSRLERVDYNQLLNNVVQLTVGICKAGYVHRDYKPANILVVGMQPWVIDLDGLSQVPRADDLQRAQRTLKRLVRDIGQLPGMTLTRRARALNHLLRALGLNDRQHRKKMWTHMDVRSVTESHGDRLDAYQ